jgi:hypothetical protein
VCDFRCLFFLCMLFSLCVIFVPSKWSSPIPEACFALFFSEIHTFSVQDEYLADLCPLLCCHWLQAANNNVGGVSNIKIKKLCLIIFQRCSRFLKWKTPLQLIISEKKQCTTRLSTRQYPGHCNWSITGSPHAALRHRCYVTAQPRHKALFVLR